MFYSSSSPGLHNVPISMSLVGYLVVTCATLNVPSLFHLHKYFICRIPEDLMTSGQLWKLVTTKLVFLDPKDLIWGATLVYQFREFERRYGSHKFASLLFGTTCISFVLEMIALLIRWFIDKEAGAGFLPTGPYGIIFPLFVRFYHEIPNTGSSQGSRSQQSSSVSGDGSSQQWTASFSSLGSIFPPITTKTLTYIFGLQLAWSSANALTAITGIMSGILHYQNFLGVQKWLVIPDWVAKISSKIFTAIVGGPPQGVGGNNNSNEQSRWFRVELPTNSEEGPWHRQIRRQGQGFAETLVYPDNYMMASQNSGNIFGGFLGSWRQHNLIENEDVFNADEFDRERDGVEIEELEGSDEDNTSGNVTGRRTGNSSEAELVNRLIDMGFQKDNALRALKSTNYDIMEATNILLRADGSSQPTLTGPSDTPSSTGREVPIAY